MVDKLSLTIKPRLKPYKLQWITNEGGIIVKDHVSVLISIGKYKEVICDVVPVEGEHILLGRPWQFDKQTLHDGLTNKISFLHQGKKIIFYPLTPQLVREDEIKMIETLEK